MNIDLEFLNVKVIPTFLVLYWQNMNKKVLNKIQKLHSALLSNCLCKFGHFLNKLIAKFVRLNLCLLGNPDSERTARPRRTHAEVLWLNNTGLKLHEMIQRVSESFQRFGLFILQIWGLTRLEN